MYRSIALEHPLVLWNSRGSYADATGRLTSHPVWRHPPSAVTSIKALQHVMSSLLENQCRRRDVTAFGPCRAQLGDPSFIFVWQGCCCRFRFPVHLTLALLAHALWKFLFSVTSRFPLINAPVLFFPDRLEIIFNLIVFFRDIERPSNSFSQRYVDLLRQNKKNKKEKKNHADWHIGSWLVRKEKENK